MNKLSFTLAVGCFTASALFAAPAVTPNTPVSAPLLFVETAESGTLTSSTLTLQNISPHTLWFSDRPNRKYGVVSTKTFIKKWNADRSAQGFRAIPPNAAIVDATVQYQDLHTVAPEQDLVIQLSQPTYNASTKTATYQVHYLNNTVPQNLPVTLDHVSIFIDDDDDDDNKLIRY